MLRLYESMLHDSRNLKEISEDLGFSDFQINDDESCAKYIFID